MAVPARHRLVQPVNELLGASGDAGPRARGAQGCAAATPPCSARSPRAACRAARCRVGAASAPGRSSDAPSDCPRSRSAGGPEQAWGVRRTTTSAARCARAGVRRQGHAHGQRLRLQVRQHLAELVFEPGMQHRIGRREHAFGPHGAGRRAKQRQQFGRAAAHDTRGAAGGWPARMPRLSRLGNGLIGAGFILAPQRHAAGFRLGVGRLDQPLFSPAFGSWTVTAPHRHACAGRCRSDTRCASCQSDSPPPAAPPGWCWRSPGAAPPAAAPAPAS